MKSLARITEPDDRWSLVGRVDPSTGEFQPVKLGAFYEAVAAVRVEASLPEEVATQFETARDLYVYAWYSYDFLVPAQLQALATLELALRERLRVHPVTGKVRGLNALLRRALRDGLLDEGTLRAAGVPDPLTKRDFEESIRRRQLGAWTSFADRALTFLSGFRNELGHGNRLLIPNTLVVLSVVARLLQHLYAKGPDQHRPGPASPSGR